MNENALMGPMPWWDRHCHSLDTQLDELVARWRNTERAAARSREFPRAIVEEFAELRLYGLLIPRKYGGELDDDIDARKVAIIGEHFGRLPSLTMHYMASAVGGARPIAEYGTEEQRARWLPDFASGRQLAAISLTESFAGSDLGNLETTAVLQADGTWELSGIKRFCSNIGIADLYMVLARVDEGDGRAPSGRRVAYFLLPKGTPGLSIGKINEMAGYEWLRNGTLVLDNVIADSAAMVAAPEFSWRLVTDGLNVERLLNLGACVGSMRETLDICAAYVNRRLKDGVPLAESDLIQAKIGDMAAEFHAARMYMHALATTVDAGLDPAGLLMSLGKMRAAVANINVTSEAVRRMGGDGYTREYGVEAFWRNARLWETGGGTSDVLAMRMGRHVLRDAAGRPWAEGSTPVDLVGDTSSEAHGRGTGMQRLMRWHQRHPGLWAQLHDLVLDESEVEGLANEIDGLVERCEVERVERAGGTFMRLALPGQIERWRVFGSHPLPAYMNDDERF